MVSGDPVKPVMDINLNSAIIITNHKDRPHSQPARCGQGYLFSSSRFIVETPPELNLGKRRWPLLKLVPADTPGLLADYEY